MHLLNLIQLEIAPFDPPTRKPYFATEHGVNPMIRCGDIAIRALILFIQTLALYKSFTHLGLLLTFRNIHNERSVVGWSVGRQYRLHRVYSIVTPMSYTRLRYVYDE